MRENELTTEPCAQPDDQAYRLLVAISRQDGIRLTPELFDEEGNHHLSQLRTAQLIVERDDHDFFITRRGISALRDVDYRLTGEEMAVLGLLSKSTAFDIRTPLSERFFQFLETGKGVEGDMSPEDRQSMFKRSQSRAWRMSLDHQDFALPTEAVAIRVPDEPTDFYDIVLPTGAVISLYPDDSGGIQADAGSLIATAIDLYETDHQSASIPADGPAI